MPIIEDFTALLLPDVLFKVLMREHKWSQRDLAAALDCSVAFVNDVVHARRDLSIHMAAKTVKLLQKMNFETTVRAVMRAQFERRLIYELTREGIEY